MKINNTIQSFNNLNGIKVNQKSNTNQEINQNKTVEVSINKNTLNSLDLLSSLKEETLLNTTNINFIHPNKEAVFKRLDNFYKEENIKNKTFENPQIHIQDKYFSQAYPHYIQGLSKVEREAGYNHEMQYLKYNKLGNISFFDTNIKDMKATSGIVEEADKRVYYRDIINQQFNQLLDKYNIEIPKDVSLTFTIEPYSYKVSVNGSNDNTLTTLIEDALNTAHNSKNLFIHIRKSNFEYKNSQINQNLEEKYSIFHEIKDKTGYDLRDLEYIDGKVLTKDGKDMTEIYKQGVINSKTIPEEYKGLIYDTNIKKLNDLMQKGFDNSPDMILSIEYKNESFYDIGQSENFGVGKREWIEKLKSSLPKTIGEAFKNYYTNDKHFETTQELIKEELNLDEFTKSGINKNLLEEYETLDPELIKLILMQKYLFGKDDEETKKFYKMLKEWEELKKEDFS